MNRSFHSLILVFVLFLGVSCSDESAKHTNKTRSQLNNSSIQLKGKIVKIEKNAMTDTMEGGEFAIFDATTIELLDPNPTDRDSIKVFRQQMQEVDGKAIGQVLDFSISKDLMAEGVTLFEGSLENIEIQEGKE